MKTLEIFFLLGGTSILLLILLVLTYIFMGSEGRYHLKRGFSRGGVDLLSYDRFNNSLTPKSLKKEGTYWTSGRKDIYLSLEAIKNPNIGQEKYNQAISGTPHWSGNRRSVLLALDQLCFVFTPDFLSLLKAAKDGADASKTKFLEWLEEKFEAGVKRVNIIDTIDLNIITDYIDGTTPYILKDSYEEGVSTGVQIMTKPQKGKMGTGMKIAIGASVIMAIIILIVIIQKGGLPIPKIGK